MKKIIALLILMLTVAALVPVSAQRVNVNININIDRQPAWGPVGFEYVDFYYFPDLNVYYDVNHGLFYYTLRGRWVSAHYLPPKYRTYDLYSMYKVVLTGHNPWVNNKVHRRQYAHFKGDRTQVVIRHSTDNRYQKSRNNNISWVEQNRTSNKKTTTSRTNTSTRSKANTRTSTSTNRSSSSSAVTNSRTSTGRETQSQSTNSRSNSSSQNNSRSSTNRSR